MIGRAISVLIASLSLAAQACSSDDRAGHESSADGSGGGAPMSDAGGAGAAGTTASDGGSPLSGCALDTGYPGDEYCIEAPPEAEGFQVHYGPTDYSDPVELARYLLEPGAETEGDYPAVAGNAEDVYFYRRQYRMRAGSHHLIVFEAGGAGSTLGTERRLGGSQNVVKDNPQGDVPPENVGIGMPLVAQARLILNLHHFNGTDGAILREAWVNVWYVDEGTVTQEAKEMFLWAQGGPVAPGATAIVQGQRSIDQEGRILTMYGHRHSNNVRFSAWRNRGGDRVLAYEDYDWLEPSVFEFNSLTTNPVPDPASGTGGALTGVLDLLPGDVIEWECEIVNGRQQTITFGENEALTSEMCILVGDAVGPTLLSAI